MRKLVHVPGGLLPPLFVWFFGWTGAAAIALFLLAYLFVGWDAGRRGTRLPIIWAGIRQTRRATEAGPLTAVEFLVAAVVIGLLFPLPYFFAAMALLGVGDGAAALIGGRWGHRKLPWNPHKSWAGLGAGILLGTPASIGFGILGGQMQAAGYARVSNFAGPIPTWPVLPFLLLGFLAVLLLSRLVVEMGGPRYAHASGTDVVIAFSAALAPALAFLFLAPLTLTGPLLPPWGGHSNLVKGLLVAVPLLVMFAESLLRRHDNLWIPGLSAALSYLIVGLGARLG